MVEQDLIAKLRSWDVHGDGSNWIETSNLLQAAATEIERLRALAGAVSQGDGSFREIAKDLPRQEPKPGYTGL